MKRRTELSLLIAGLMLICLGSLLNFISNKRLQDFLQKQFVLSQTSLSYPFWKKIPMEINDKMYFFNWTNPSDLKEPGYKPKLEEVGPYSFDVTLGKRDVIWNDNGTVTYTKVRTWFFNAKDSSGNFTDVLNTLNLVAATAAYLSRNWMSFARKLMSIPITAVEEVHVTKTFGELTFEGYPDPLLGAGSILPGLAKMIPQDRSGYFYAINGTSFEGTYNTETGVNGMERMGLSNTWNYQNRTKFYDLPCGQVKGTSGALFTPNRKKTDDVILFSSEFCRYIVFKYKRTVNMHGIEAYRYELDPDVYDNGTSTPENRCFCGGECIPSGALNVSACRFGAPLFASPPHFYNSDQSYRDAVEGMKPDPERHTMYMILEPTYSFMLEFGGRLQFNLMIRPDPDIGMFMDIPKIFFPIFWMRQEMLLPQHFFFYIKIMLALPTICYVFSVVFLVLGTLSFLLIFISRIQPVFKNLIRDFNLSFNNSLKLSTRNEKEVRSLMTSTPKPEILPEAKEIDGQRLRQQSE